jgi:eukaryotic-like serine/threonine-protein kinase
MGTRTRLRLPRNSFVDAVRKSGLLSPDDLVAFIMQHDMDDKTLEDPIKFATLLVKKKLLTKYQAMQLLNNRTHGFKLDHYTIQDGIRQDRVGMVFTAEDTNSKKRVAIKILPTDRTSDPTILNAFLNEVRTAAQVEHPNVARVLDLGCHLGTHYVVTEHVTGRTLDKVVAKSGPLQPDLAAQFMAQVAIALRFAHKHQLYHRDIKPANIAVGEDGRVKLIDLGLTHMLENPWKQVTKRIKTQEYADEIDHVAPEQAWGNEPDARSDIYSLGSTLYWLITGTSPFPGMASEKMAERQVRDIPNPADRNPNVTPELAAVVQKMGARDPYSRYQSTTELLVAMQGWLPITDWLAVAASMPSQQPTLPNRLTDSDTTQTKGGFFSRFFGRK